MPAFKVRAEEGQPAQLPRICRNTVPLLPSQPLNVISPPSLATAGRTRVFKSSMICSTTSASSPS